MGEVRSIGQYLRQLAGPAAFQCPQTVTPHMVGNLPDEILGGTELLPAKRQKYLQQHLLRQVLAICAAAGFADCPVEYFFRIGTGDFRIQRVNIHYPAAFLINLLNSIVTGDEKA